MVEQHLHSNLLRKVEYLLLLLWLLLRRKVGEGDLSRIDESEEESNLEEAVAEAVAVA